MTTEPQSLNETLIRQLFELANTPFELRAFKNCWEAFGWLYEPTASDEFGFWLKISEGLSMMVNPLGDRVISASLPFYYWEEFDSELCDSQTKYEQGRDVYKSKFESSTELAQQVLGKPAIRWRDANKNAHEAIAWLGQHGLLILQQADFDVQYGMELNFWLERCTIEEFTPKTPLIDWLSLRSKKLHDEHGFPPLQF